MRCNNCPLYMGWNNESGCGESCHIFGDGWDSPFMYKDKEGTIVGCYLDPHFVKKCDDKISRMYEEEAEFWKEKETNE